MKMTHRGSSDDLVVSSDGCSYKVTLQNWFASPVYQVEKVQFGDGTVWDTRVLIKAPRSVSIVGDTGADDMFGTYNVDDYYLFGRGDGNVVSVEHPNGLGSTCGAM